MYITKKIYPTAGQGREMLDKLSRPIEADRRAAFVFQAVEVILETAAIYVIIMAMLAFIAPTAAANFWHLALFISAVCAYYIQLQYTVTLDMVVHLEEDQKLAAKLQKTKSSYTRSRAGLFILALVLNTVGGFVLVNKVTFKADKGSLDQLDKEHRENVQRIEGNYKAALGGLAAFDDQAAQSRAAWDLYGQKRPSEVKYAALKAKSEGADLLNKKTALTEQATKTRAAEIKAEESSYKSRRTAITSALQTDLDKQFWQELAAAFGATLFSFAMLSLVWVFHTRATRHELICGVRYRIQMPSNEHQSPVQTVAFLGKFVAYGLVQMVAVGIFKVAEFMFRFRLNFAGHGDTVEQKAHMKLNTAEAKQAAEVLASAAPENAVHFEVEQGNDYSIQDAIEEERMARERAAQARAAAVGTALNTANNAYTSANSSNSANTANSAHNDNSQYSVEIDNSEEDLTTALPTVPTADNADQPQKPMTFLEQFRADKAAQANLQKFGVEQETIEKIQAARAQSARLNKSQIVLEHEGKTFTIRDAEKRIETYKARANNPNSAEETRAENARKAELWAQLVQIQINKN